MRRLIVKLFAKKCRRINQLMAKINQDTDSSVDLRIIGEATNLSFPRVDQVLRGVSIRYQDYDRVLNYVKTLWASTEGSRKR